MSMASYKIGHLYVDKGGSSHDEDQFLKWINIKGSGMRNMSGIRALNFVCRKSDFIPAYIILVSTRIKHEGNPWDDIVDYNSSTIYYWGDAKFDKEKHYQDFVGNQRLIQTWNLILENKLDLVPPILHFSKPKSGFVKFTGLCVLTDLKHSWFDHEGEPVKNLKAELRILDQEEVDVAWLHRRAKCEDLSILNKDCPDVWRQYIKGKTIKLDLHKKHIKKKTQQLPASGSDDESVLKQLSSLPAHIFEVAVVELFRQLPHVNHNITRTRFVKDDGFDFYGEFSIPFPLAYSIEFLGEVKRHKSSIGPEYVSRLVARLGRGQYGIFVTTSYYTEQAQREVLEDEYPVRLYSGIDLVNFLRELRLIRNNRIKEDWLNSLA
jgi:hypothetical protein